jgi:hypothetical protein
MAYWSLRVAANGIHGKSLMKPFLRWISKQRLLLFLTALAFVHLAFLCGDWRFLSDSFLYVGVGESLADGRGYEFNGHPHVFCPPGLPALIAIIESVAGRWVLGFNLIGTISGIGAMALTYCLLRGEKGLGAGSREAAEGSGIYPSHVSSRLPIAVAALTGVNAVLILHENYVLSDVPTLCLVLAALIALKRFLEAEAFCWRYALAASTVAGMAVMMRVAAVPLLGAVCIGLFARKDSLRLPDALKSFVAAAPGTVMTLAWFLWCWANHPRGAAFGVYQDHLDVAWTSGAMGRLADLGATASSFLQQMPSFLGGDSVPIFSFLNVMCVVLLCMGAYRHVHLNGRWAFIALLYTMLYFTLIVLWGLPWPRFLILILPFLYLNLLLGVQALGEALSGVYGAPRRIAAAALLVVFATDAVAFPGITGHPVWRQYSAAYLVVLVVFIAAIGMLVFFGSRPAVAHRMPAAMVAIVVCLAAALNLYDDASRWLEERVSVDLYRRYHRGYYDGLEECCAWLKKNTPQDAAVFVGAFNFERVYVLSGRRTFDSTRDPIYDTFPYMEGVDRRPAWAMVCPATGQWSRERQVEKIIEISGGRAMQPAFEAGKYAVYALEDR